MSVDLDAERVPRSVSTADLARRLEQVNADALLHFTDVCARAYPGIGATALGVAGGVAAYVGAQVPFSYAVGLGMAGAVTAEEIERVSSFYITRDAEPHVEVCPLADESLFTGLRRHNFQVHGFISVMARFLEDDAEYADPAADHVMIREARPDEAELWMRTVDEGLGGESMTEPRRRFGLLSFQSERTTCYLAEADGQPAGGAVLYTHNGYAGLMTASVLERFRGRGIHAGLIRTRLRKAREQGCDLAVYFAEPGSQSERNAERHGFRLAYSRATMKPGIVPTI